MTWSTGDREGLLWMFENKISEAGNLGSAPFLPIVNKSMLISNSDRSLTSLMKHNRPRKIASHLEI